MPTTQVLMPQLGESVVEGVVSKWLKQEGDPVQEFEPLLEINTDKVDTEIPAPASGVVLRLLVAPGTTVKAGAPIAVIGLPDDAPAPAPTNGHSQAAAAEAGTPAARRELGFISPVVAKLADEHGVDLHQVAGSGLGGRITKKDVLNYLETRKGGVALPASALPASAAPVSAGPAPAEPKPGPALSQPLAVISPPPTPGPPASEDSLRVEGMRQLIAEHMVRSKRTAPHVTTVFEVDMTRPLAHLEANQAAFARDGVKLTLTAYFLSAIVAGLKAVPLVNSQWVEDAGGARIVLKREINIGMAVALEAGEQGAGLIVPVIKRADEKSLLGLAREINDLARRARSRSLKPDEVQGGTFTLTNHGVSGSLFATPIINQPQTGILGAGVVQKRVVVITRDGQDSLAIRPMVYLTLTFDHRVLDGATGDRFMQAVKAALENWS